jgi:hypothetical protein
MKIITQQIYQSKGKRTTQALNSILKEWKWGNQPIKTSQEFLTKMKPWISERIKERKELEEFLKKKGVKSLGEIN